MLHYPMLSLSLLCFFSSIVCACVCFCVCLCVTQVSCTCNVLSTKLLFLLAKFGWFSQPERPQGEALKVGPELGWCVLFCVYV